MSRKASYDLIIIGGGLVGASLAIALKHLPISIALIDAKLPSADDHRLFALNINSCQMLMNLGLWDTLQAVATPIDAVHVTRQKQFGSVRLRKEDLALNALGYVIPAYSLESALNDKLSAFGSSNPLARESAIHIFRPAILKNIFEETEEVHLTIEMNNEEMQFTAGNVIAADGTNSSVRQLLNIETETHDYAQEALVTRTKLNRSHHHVAHERFIKDGAIAMLPLPNHECATIWSADTAKIKSLVELNENDFVNELQREFGYRLGRFQTIKERYSYPLRMLRAKKMAKGNVLLLGNAAHTLHPIAAQGLNLALYEVAYVYEEYKKNSLKQKVLTAENMASISQVLQVQQSKSVNFSHALSTWFSMQSLFVNVGLQLGMLSLNMFTPLKKNFMNQMICKTNGTSPLLFQSDQT